jgi:hypothetical protein
MCTITHSTVGSTADPLPSRLWESQRPCHETGLVLDANSALVRFCNSTHPVFHPGPLNQAGPVEAKSLKILTALLASDTA